MEEKKITITEDDFKKATMEVMEEMMKDEKLDGMGKLLIPLTGAMFAKEVANKLFKED